jgi:anti-sigma B factor antagonist
VSETLVLPDAIAGPADVLPPAFVCTCRDGGLDAAWVHVAGELDIATAPQLERTLAQAQSQARLVLLDLRGLAFMDSSGMHAIADAGIRARQVARRLIVLRGCPDVDRIFTLNRGVDAVEIHELDPGEPPVQLLLRLAD